MTIMITKRFIFFLQIQKDSNFNQMFNHIRMVAGVIAVTVTQHNFDSGKSGITQRMTQVQQKKRNSILRVALNSSLI